MDIRRHHLIEEAKAELDVAYEEVKRAENRLIELEREYGARIEDVRRTNGAKMPRKVEKLVAERDARRSSIDMPSAYFIEKVALERFAVLSAAFSTVCANADPDEAAQTLESIVFRPGEIEQVEDDIPGALARFAHGLRAYTTETSSGENDRTVRDSWAVIEAALRRFGRAI